MTSFAVGTESEARASRGWQILLGSVVLAALFVGIEWCIRVAGHLPEAYYFRASISLGLIQSFLNLPGLALLGLSVIAVVVLRTKEEGRAILRAWVGPWRDWEYGEALRVVIGVAAAVVAWALVSYAPNPYFGQSYIVDRTLIGVGFLALIWRPVAILPFTVLAVAFVGQLDYPLADHPWTEINLPLRILFLFSAAHLVGSVRRIREMHTFLLVLCCLIAINYWWSGQGKWELGWITHRHLNLLILGAYANGWLQVLDPESVVRLSERIAPFNAPLMLLTLVVEWGAVVLLFRRWTLVGFLVCAAAFHTGIFAFSGMLFWKWIAVELALLWFLLSKRRIRTLHIFTPAHFLTSVVLILGCKVWVTAQDLSWYDTPLTYTVRLTGVGASGQGYALPTRYTAPYNDMFFLAPFHYLTPHPQITSVMGAAGPPHARADSILEAGATDAVLAIEHRQPATPVDSAKAERFDALVAAIAAELNERGVPRERWLRAVRAPAHLWNFARRSETVFTSQEPLTQVQIDVVLSYYDGVSYADIERRTIRTVEVPAR